MYTKARWIPTTLLLAVVPIRFSNDSKNYKFSGILVPKKHKFVGVEQLSRSIAVRRYNGVTGKILLLVELAFAVYAWLFVTFGYLLSFVGLGFIFPPIMNTNFIQSVILQRSRSLAKSTSSKVGESKKFSILYQSPKEIVIQWNDTKDVAYLKRVLGIWRVAAYLMDVKNVDKFQWSETELLERDRVIYTANIKALTYENLGKALEDASNTP